MEYTQSKPIITETEIADYIAETLAELRAMAVSRGMKSLAVLLELAARDAENYIDGLDQTG